MTTRVEDGTVTYDRASGDATNGSGQITDHFQFSADGETMTHTHRSYNPDGTYTTAVQAYRKVECNKIKKAKKRSKTGPQPEQ